MKHFLTILFIPGLAFAPLSAAGEETHGDSAAGADAAETERVCNYEEKRQSLQRRMDACTEQFKSMEKPPRSLSLAYERCLSYAPEHLKAVEKKIAETEEFKLKLAGLSGEPFVFTIIPDDQRMKYVEEGREAIRMTMHALRARTEAQQVEGIGLFSKVREHYRGIPEYAEAKKTCVDLLVKLGKKWKRGKDSLSKSREKLSGAAADKAKAADERSYEKLRQSRSSGRKDLQEVWYVPLQSNLKMLEEMCDKVNTFAKSIAADRTEGEGQTEMKLEEFWTNMDKIRDMMSTGKLEEASEALRSDQSFPAVRGLPESYLAADFREKLGEQFDALRTEVRNRMRTISKLENSIKRNVGSMERSLNTVEQQISRLETECSNFLGARKTAGEDAKLSDKESSSQEGLNRADDGGVENDEGE